MKKFFKFPKIEQYRHLCRVIKTSAEFQGYDKENSQAVVDSNAVKPTLTLNGTVKIHGTNAGIVYDVNNEEIYALSRNSVINVESDNAGFAFFVESNKTEILELMSRICENTFLPYDYIVIHGEWFGGNIQKGVAVNGIEKTFACFSGSVYAGERTINITNLACSIASEYNDNRIYSIKQFGTYELEVDFNEPNKSTSQLNELTLEVEKQCPVGKFFGQEGIGEGIVWTVEYKDTVYKCKVKGNAHSKSKVKKLAAVDPIKLENIDSFVTAFVDEGRLLQSVEQVITLGDVEHGRGAVGKLIKWMMSDLCKEEIDTMKSNNLVPKDIQPKVAIAVRNWYFGKLDAGEY